MGTIRGNDSITWINQDDESHTLLGDNIESPLLSPGDRYTAFFGEEGTQRYVCTTHPSMTGVIEVVASNQFAPPVQISRPPYVDPLPGFSFTLVEGVSTYFPATPGIFDFGGNQEPDPRSLPSNYFYSPNELPDASGCSLLISMGLLLACLLY